MNASRTIFLAAAGLACLIIAAPAAAAPPELEGQISGIELAPQSLVGAAVFLFEYQGQVNGRDRKGWGWVAVVHQDLPEMEGGFSFILDGSGEIYIGVQRFNLDVKGGLLTLVDDHDTPLFDDDFEILLSVDIRNRIGQSKNHLFDGVLSHVPFPPTIDGDLAPAP
jgi:hypothetical protein